MVASNWDKQPVVEQVWFPGVHGDAGGGYEENRDIGDLTLDWMVKRVTSNTDLRFDLEPDGVGTFDRETIERKALGPLNRSDRGKFILYRLLPFYRVIAGRTNGLERGRYRCQLLTPRETPIAERLHFSALHRLKNGPNYRPDNLVAAKDVPAVDHMGVPLPASKPEKQ